VVCDPSGGANDAFTLAIAHHEGKTAILDLVRERQPPLSPEAVIEEYAGVLRKYRITQVIGDRYAGEFPREVFRKHGVNFEPAERSSDLVSVINSRGCDLLDNNRLVGQLIGLERRVRTAGRDLIDHAPGGHDDLANAVAGALLEANKAPPSNFYRQIKYYRTGARLAAPPPSHAAALALSKGTPAVSSSRETCTADHLPPRAAGMPPS
jgi:hypothetical protein